MANEYTCTYDEDAREWTVVGPVGRPIISKAKAGVEYKTEVEGSSRPPKWGRSNKANSSPGPKMGTSPFQPKPKPQPQQRRSGAYVCWQTPGCPGVRGRASYRYLQDLEETEEVLYCTACATPWAWSKAQAIKTGQIPSYPAPSANPPKSKKSDQGLKPAVPHSPFVAIPDEPAGPTAPFAAPRAKSCFAPEIPQNALDACELPFHPFLKAILLEGGKEHNQCMHDLIEKKAAAGDQGSKSYMCGHILGKAAMYSGTLASAPFAPTPAPKTPEEPADAPIRQRVASAYTAKQAAAAEVSRAERALQAGDKAKQQAL